MEGGTDCYSLLNALEPKLGVLLVTRTQIPRSWGGAGITGLLMFKVSQKEGMDLPCYGDKASSFRRGRAAPFSCDVLVTLLANRRAVLSLLPVPGFNCPSLVWVLGLGQRPVLCDGALQDEHPDSGGGLVHHGVKVRSTSCQSLLSLVCRWRIINWPSAVGIRVDVLGHIRSNPV